MEGHAIYMFIYAANLWFSL